MDPEYEPRPENPPHGICVECHVLLHPKLGGTAPEWFCKYCSGGRKFCSNKECWFLIEPFYSECGFEQHYKFILRRGNVAISEQIISQAADLLHWDRDEFEQDTEEEDDDQAVYYHHRVL